MGTTRNLSQLNRNMLPRMMNDGGRRVVPNVRNMSQAPPNYSPYTSMSPQRPSSFAMFMQMFTPRVPQSPNPEFYASQMSVQRAMQMQNARNGYNMMRGGGGLLPMLAPTGVGFNFMNNLAGPIMARGFGLMGAMGLMGGIGSWGHGIYGGGYGYWGDGTHAAHDGFGTLGSPPFGTLSPVGDTSAGVVC